MDVQRRAQAMDTVTQNQQTPANGTAEPPVIDLVDLSLRFGKRDILQDLRCRLSGRAIGLLGPNGAGKSTLINTLLGFYKPSSGSARVFGYDIRQQTAQIRALVGYMPENDAFISEMSAVSFVRLMAELSGLPCDAALERAHEALFYVGLGEARYRSLGTYSLGMKQLAKLAQAIVHGPRLLILDEPTNSLDVATRQRMLRLIREIRDTGQLHIVLCSHLLYDVEECCDEVLILKEGHIVHLAGLEERRANKRFLELEIQGTNSDFTAALEHLGCVCSSIATGRMKVTMAEGIKTRDIYRLAAERNIQIRRLSFRQNSLEDLFLKSMEKR